MILLRENRNRWQIREFGVQSSPRKGHRPSHPTATLGGCGWALGGGCFGAILALIFLHAASLHTVLPTVVSSYVAFHSQTLDRATTFHNLNFSTVTSLPVFPFPFRPSKSKELLEAATALPWAELSFRCQRSSRRARHWDVAWVLPEWLWIWGPRKQTTREEEKQEEIGVKKAPRLKASSIQKHSSEPLTKPTRTRFRKKMSVLKLRVRSTALAPGVRVSCSKNQNPSDSHWDQSYWDVMAVQQARPSQRRSRCSHFALSFTPLATFTIRFLHLTQGVSTMLQI